MIADVLMYMDRQFCLISGPKVALFISGIELFRLEILELVIQRLIVKLLDEFRKDRLYSNMDRRLIRQITSMFMHADPNIPFYRSRKQDRELNDVSRIGDAEKITCWGEFYVSRFENRFLEETTSFYHAESADAINKLTVVQFIDQVRYGDVDVGGPGAIIHNRTRCWCDISRIGYTSLISY